MGSDNLLGRPPGIEHRAFEAVTDWTLEAIRLAALVGAGEIPATRKGEPFDIVTPADALIEAYLREQVRSLFPQHGFVGEEGGRSAGENDWRWLVDPVDGTLNFATGLSGASCSIALLHGDEPVLGAVGDFGSGLAYRALSGTGVILCHDGRQESRRYPSHTEVGMARVFVELGWEDLDPVMVRTLELLAQGRQRSIRMVGGAAFALLNVALHGGAMVGIGLRLWDVAAGVVLAREAGLAVEMWPRGTRVPDALVHLVAGTAQDVDDLMPITHELASARAGAA